jgi:hypothetical protein
LIDNQKKMCVKMEKVGCVPLPTGRQANTPRKGVIACLREAAQAKAG